MGTIARRASPLAAAALLGGGVAVAVEAVVADGDTTPVVREVAGELGPSIRFAGSGVGLTIQEIYRTAGAGVLQVTASHVISSDPVFGIQESTSLGSGFVIDTTGHIVTN